MPIQTRELTASSTQVAAAKLAQALSGAKATTSRIARRPAGLQRIPLSFAQESLWFLEQAFSMGHAYHVRVAVRLSGPLNVAVLQRSLTDIVRRHESLRTRFPVFEDEPYQLIEPPFPVRVPVIELDGCTAAASPGMLEDRLRQDLQARFDLAASTPWRASILRLATSQHVLLITMHHMVTDGWANQLLLKEMAALYPQLCAGRAPNLPTSQIQYADFALWQRARLEEEVLQRQLSYWKAHLQGAPSLIDIPRDRSRPPAQSHRGGCHVFEIHSELSRRLRALGETHHVTMFMILFSAFLTLLHCWSGAIDIVVGSPISGGRRLKETQSLIGFFVNTLALRTDLGGDPTFVELLERVKITTLEALSHQELPFGRIVQELRPRRSCGAHPVYQVEFTLQISPGMSWRRRELAAGGLRIADDMTFRWGDLLVESIPQTSGAAKFDLSCSMYESADHGYAGAFEYATDLFDEDTIERLGQGIFQHQ